MSVEPISFEAWVAGVSDGTTGDPLWRLPAYRLATYGAEVGWPDVRALARIPVAAPVAGQLYRALGSIGANLAEGYGRSSGRDRARLYEYALGSARECVSWYRLTRPILGEPAVRHHHETLQRIVRILLTAIPQERRHDLDARR